MFEGVKLDECCSTCFPWNMESAAKRGTATPPRQTVQWSDAGLEFQEEVCPL